MKKFFLIPLMTLLTCVMAWGEATEIVVNDFGALKTALSSEGTAAVVKLGQNIAYPTNGGSDLLDIQRSLTLDGNGYKLSGYAVRGAHTGQGTNPSTYGYGQYNKVTLVINHKAAHSGLTVTLKDLAVEAGRADYSVGVFTYDDIDSLAIVNCTLTQPVGTNGTSILYYGESAAPLKLFIQNSYITAKHNDNGNGGYGMEVLKPIKANFENSTFEGFCSMTFKYPLGLTSTNRWCVGLGTQNVGARGTTIKANNCQFIAPNVYNGESNAFGTFVCEEDGINIELHNCGMNAEKRGTALQKMFYASDYTPESRRSQPLSLTISGDNSHINGNFVDNRYWVPVSKADKLAEVTTPVTNSTSVSITISGGTYSVDPRTVKIYHDVTSVTSGAPAAGSPYWTIGIDPEKYEVKTVTMEGVANPLYRVVPKTTTLYNLNSDVQSQGDGQNPTTSFELSDGSNMTLNQATTKAGYVEVSNNTTVTVANGQTLAINNGLDVQGTSVVTAKPGSALVIGEGGIVTKSSSSIVVEADNNGAASLLLDPAISVNQTPELTVKMTAKQVGIADGDYHWHRFAMPVKGITTLPKTPERATKLFYWNYDANGGEGDWASIASLTDMQPFHGYNLSTTHEGLEDVVYTFKGKLAGNINKTLSLTHQGYNFFGNSYTGYIKLSTLANEITGNSDLDWTVWVWDTEHQTYASVSLKALQDAEAIGEEFASAMYKDWQREIAPMQTFILRLPNTDNAETVVDYASTIWGNPRYSAATSALSAAPARRNATAVEGNIIRLAVADENGSSDAILLMEKNNYSDNYDNGYDAVKYMNSNTINMFTTIDGEDLSSVATDNLEGKTLTIQTKEAVNYTLSVEAVFGKAYAIRDNMTGKVIAIEEGTTYEFAAQPNSTVEGRFEIIGRNNVPTAIENTEVKANVKGIYSITGQYLGEDFNALPAGIYVVNGVKIVK